MNGPQMSGSERQLGARCWYVDFDVEGDGEPRPHFDTHAQARACAAAEVVEEGRSRPVLRCTPAACWVAECARCGRPLGDREERWDRLHCATRPELRTELTAAGWQQTTGDGGWWCPGCAAARPGFAELTRVPVTLRGPEGTSREVSGEVTACPQLALTVLRGAPPGQPWLGVALTHRPTGRYLPTGVWTNDVAQLHRVVELLTHLDWTSPDPAHYATGYARALIEALEAAGWSR